MPTSDPLRQYIGLIWIGDNPGKRIAVMASSPEDAYGRVETEYGEGHVISIRNEDDANSPRKPAHGASEA